MRSKMVMKRCKKQRVVGRCSRILDLPIHLVYEILCRLCVLSVISCKCVCKTFRDILTDPHFAQLHLRNGPEKDDAMIVQHRLSFSKMLIIYNNKFGIDKKSDFDSPRPCQTLALPPASLARHNPIVNIVGSCNGLVCIRYLITDLCDICYICNPILGEYFALPSHVDPFACCAFGYCPKTKKYKVIRIVGFKVSEIYTLGTDQYWRNIGSVPCPLSYGNLFSCLNGDLFSITKRSKTTSISNLICSFNLETEQLSYICPPVQLTQEIYREIQTMRVGSLGGSLYLSYCVGSQFEVFVMKKDNWIKEFSVSLCHISREYYSIFLDVNLLNNGNLILVTENFDIICHNLWTGTTRVMLDEKFATMDVVSYIPSFISVKDIVASAGNKNVEIIQRKLIRNPWTEKGYPFIVI